LLSLIPIFGFEADKSKRRFYHLLDECDLISVGENLSLFMRIFAFGRSDEKNNLRKIISAEVVQISPICLRYMRYSRIRFTVCRQS